MGQDDRLFFQVLIVIGTVVSAVLCTLVLAPPPALDWDADPASSAQVPSHTLGVGARAPRAHVVISRGPHAAPAPIQTAELVAGIQAHLGAAAPERRSFPAARAASAEKAGGAITLEPEAHPSPAAVQAAVRELGGEPAAGGNRTRPAPAPLSVPLPRLDMTPLEVNVDAARPRPVAAPPLHPDPRPAPEEEEEDPLPEFRRYLLRAQQCAVQAARAAGAPVTGKVVLHFTVEPTGWVRRAWVAGGSLKDPDARDCLVRTLKAEPFFEHRPEPITAERAVVLAH